MKDVGYEKFKEFLEETLPAKLSASFEQEEYLLLQKVEKFDNFFDLIDSLPKNLWKSLALWLAFFIQEQFGYQK